MKRKKLPHNINVSSRVITNTVILEPPVNCSLCHRGETEIIECQQYLINNLESAFEFKLRTSDKNQLKICVTCSYHIVILAKFVNENICLSGSKPLCFMCKSFTVVYVEPNDVKELLQNTPFGKQTDVKGNYHACLICLYQLKQYQHYKNLVDNYWNGVKSIVTSISDRAKSTHEYSKNTPQLSEWKCGLIVLVEKLDVSKFKFTKYNRIDLKYNKPKNHRLASSSPKKKHGTKCISKNLPLTAPAKRPHKKTSTKLKIKFPLQAMKIPKVKAGKIEKHSSKARAFPKSTTGVKRAAQSLVEEITTARDKEPPNEQIIDLTDDREDDEQTKIIIVEDIHSAEMANKSLVNENTTTYLSKPEKSMNPDEYNESAFPVAVENAPVQIFDLLNNGVSEETASQSTDAIDIKATSAGDYQLVDRML